MRSAYEILADEHISTARTSIGHHYALCPKCSHLRKKKREKCLSVKIDEAGVQYFCHHCGWHGGAFYDGKDPGRQAPGVAGGSRDRPGSSRSAWNLYRPV